MVNVGSLRGKSHSDELLMVHSNRSGRPPLSEDEKKSGNGDEMESAVGHTHLLRVDLTESVRSEHGVIIEGASRMRYGLLSGDGANEGIV